MKTASPTSNPKVIDLARIRRQARPADPPKANASPFQSAPVPARQKPRSQAPDPAEAAMNFVRTEILESLAKIDEQRPALLDTVRIYLSGMVCGISRET